MMPEHAETEGLLRTHFAPMARLAEIPRGMTVILRASTKDMITFLGKRYADEIQQDQVYVAKLAYDMTTPPGVKGNRRWIFNIKPCEEAGRFVEYYGSSSNPTCSFAFCVRCHCDALAALKHIGIDTSKEKENPRPNLIIQCLFDDGLIIVPPTDMLSLTAGSDDGKETAEKKEAQWTGGQQFVEIAMRSS